MNNENLDGEVLPVARVHTIKQQRRTIMQGVSYRVVIECRGGLNLCDTVYLDVGADKNPDINSADVVSFHQVGSVVH